MDEWINEWMDEYMNERMNELLATRYGPTIMSRSCHALQSQLQKSFCLVSEKIDTGVSWKIVAAISALCGEVVCKKIK